jgi:hypothetical protein
MQIKPDVSRRDLSKRAEELFLDGRTQALDEYIEGSITSKDELKARMVEVQEGILNTLHDEGFIEVSKGPRYEFEDRRK